MFVIRLPYVSEGIFYQKVLTNYIVNNDQISHFIRCRVYMHLSPLFILYYFII